MRKHGFLLRYVFAYVFLIVIPVLGLLIYQYNSSIQTIETDFVHSQYTSLVQTRNHIELEMERIPEIRSLVSLDSSFSVSELQSSNFASYTAYQRLKEFSVYSDIIESLIVYSDAFPFVLTASGTVTKTYFSEVLLRLDEMSFAQMQENFDSLRKNQVMLVHGSLHNRQKKTYLMYWFPLDNGVVAFPRTLLIMIDPQRFAEVADSFARLDTGNFAIFDKKDQYIVAQSGSDTLEAKDILPELESLSAEEGNTHWINGRKYFVTQMYGSSTGWTYVSYTSYASIAGSQKSISYRYFSFAMGLMLISGLLLYVFLVNNYLPLKRLEVRVREKLKITGEQDSIETIQEGFSYLDQKIGWVENRLAQSRDVVMQVGIQRLSQGLQPEGIFADALAVDQDGWLVGMVVVPGVDAVIELKRSMTDALTSLHFYYLAKQPRVFLILMNVNADRRSECVELMHAFASQRKGCEVIVSRMGHSVAELPQLALEISSRFYALPLLCETTDSSKESNPKKNIETILREICAAVLEKDIAKLIKIRCQWDETAIAGITLAEAEYWFLRIWWVLRTCPDTTVRDDCLRARERMRMSFSLRAFSCELLTVMKRTEHALATTDEDEKIDDAVREYQLYMESHFLDKDFSLMEMARVMNTSPSNMSNTYRKKMGVTMMDYVHKLRMDQAMRMLREAKYSVTEIAAMIGYQSVSSFIRAFRSEVSMTPKQYVDQYRRGDGQNEHRIDPLS